MFIPYRQAKPCLLFFNTVFFYHRIVIRCFCKPFFQDLDFRKDIFNNWYWLFNNFILPIYFFIGLYTKLLEGTFRT